mmetsp:Transcript_67289/g.140572  ORF Transcript_67289/g.140572 Transcript_67289/m.140572 type:complete len:83 (+) Transcript_67289:248-496(+)
MARDLPFILATTMTNIDPIAQSIPTGLVANAKFREWGLKVAEKLLRQLKSNLLTTLCPETFSEGLPLSLGHVVVVLLFFSLA